MALADTLFPEGLNIMRFQFILWLESFFQLHSLHRVG
jgi:hypothetical protein